MADGNYTFYPRFAEYISLYRGVVRVWIEDGSSQDPDRIPGKLYAEYVEGVVQDLGYVSDYNEAKQHFADLGIDLTYPQWVELLANTPNNVSDSEAWAKGTRGEVAVGNDDPTHFNNSRYYAEISHLENKLMKGND